MSDRLVDVRTPLAACEEFRLEVGQDGVMYVVTPAVTLHLEREHCEQLAATMARGLARLAKIEAARKTPRLRMVHDSQPSRSAAADSSSHD